MPISTTPTTPTARPGKPDAESEFEALYRDSRDDLFSYLAYLVGDHALAEEIVAAAFERALRKRRLFQRSRGDLRGWLFSIARNLAVDELRRSGRETALELVPEAALPAAGGDQTDRRIYIAQALRGLQARERELIALKFFAGLSNAEISRVLGCSASNAGTQVHRAMTSLRKQIGATDEF